MNDERLTPTELGGNEVKSFEEKVQDLSKNFLNIVPALCAIGIALWWIFSGAVKIGNSELTIVNRLGLTICTIMFALSYTKLIADGGFKTAKGTRKYKQASQTWSDSIIKGNKDKKEIICYAKDIAKDNLYLNRVENLENNLLYYDDFFDKEGNLTNTKFKDNKYNKKKNPYGYTRKQIRIIQKCVKSKIVLPQLFGNISSKYFGIRGERTQKQFSRNNDIKNTIVKVVLSVVSVGLTFEWIGFTLGALIYALFQIMMWTATGVLQRMKNFNFVMDELVPQMVERSLIINGYMELSDEKKKEYHNRVVEEDESRHRLRIEYKGGQDNAR